MRAKRRHMHGKRLRRSALRKNYDFSKTADYSSEATKDTIGAKFAKAITPENTVKGVLGTLAPIGKAGKILKTAYNYLSS